MHRRMSVAYSDAAFGLPVIQISVMPARQAAEELNRRGIPAPAGGKWFAARVIRVRRRLGA